VKLRTKKRHGAVLKINREAIPFLNAQSYSVFLD